MAVRLVRCALGQHRGPAAGDLERVVADAQEAQDARDAALDACSELAKLAAAVQRVPCLPALANRQRRQLATKLCQRCHGGDFLACILCRKQRRTRAAGSASMQRPSLRSGSRCMFWNTLSCQSWWRAAGK